MQIIQPINESTVRKHIGKPVCAVMHDGTPCYGYLEDVRDGKLWLCLEPVQQTQDEYDDGWKGKAKTNRRSGKRRKLKTSAFGPPFGPPFADRFALDLALITLLFLLPFGFF